MQDINHIILIGRVTRNLDDKTYNVLSNGTARATVSVAVNRSVKKDNQWIDEVSFFDVTIWGKTAENLRKYLVKGQQVAVDGYLKQDRWEKDGQKHSKISIVADSIQLLGGKKDGVQQNSSNQPSAQQNFNPSEGFPEDIPF